MTKIVSTPIPIESWHHNWIKNVFNQLKKNEIWVFIMILLPHKSITEFLSIFMTTLACVTGNNDCDIITIG